MAVHRVPLCNRYNQVLGWLKQDWYYLPELIQVRGQLYFRTGPSGAHKYQLCEKPHVVIESETAQVIMET